MIDKVVIKKEIVDVIVCEYCSKKVVGNVLHIVFMCGWEASDQSQDSSK